MNIDVHSHIVNGAYLDDLVSTLRLDTVWTALLTGQDSVAREVILDLRLPRALNAFTVGGLLALSGVLMQVLLRNSLADPYVLGISGGAAVAATETRFGKVHRFKKYKAETFLPARHRKSVTFCVKLH